MSQAACPTCVFGAVTTDLLSYQLHAIQTITVSVIPHVTVWTNGTEKTSFERITETNTDFVHSGGNGTTPQTFTDKKDITWTVGDATLTYPTTYVRYLAFEGATASSGPSETCADPTEASAVELPESTSCAPFIYPYEGQTSAMALPTPLLEYLGQLPLVSEQFNGLPLTGCAPLSWTPPASVSASATTSSAPQLFSSTSVPAGYQSSALAPQTTLPSSYSLYSPPAESSSRRGNYSMTLSSSHGSSFAASESYISPSDGSTSAGSSLVPSSSSETPVRESTYTRFPTTTATTGHHSPLTPGNPIPSPSSAPAPSPPESGSHSAPAYSQPAYSTGSAEPPGGTQTHSTAFVIEPITGPTTYTTISGPNADHTKKPNGPGKTTDKPDGNPQNPGGTTPHHTHDNGKPTGKPSNGHTPGAPISPVDNGNGKHHHTTPPVYTNDGHSITAKSGGEVVIGSQTVRPGDKITIGSGSHKTEVALQTDHGKTRLNIGGTIYSVVPDGPKVTPGPGGKPSVSVGVITTNGHTITAVRSGKSVVLVDGTSSTTVLAGEQVTFDGEKISVPPRGGSIAVNGNGVPLTAGDGASATVTAGGHTFTAIDAGKSIMLKDGSSTVLLKDGGKTVFEGQTISVVPSGTAIVVNGKTTLLSASGKSGASKTTTGVGAYITGGLGGTHGGSSPASTSVLPSNGTGSSLRFGDVRVLSACVLGFMSVLAFW